MAHNRRFLHSPQPRHLTTPPAALADALREHYTLERELGRGGMAPVYLARDLKHGRMVALKVLRPELAHVLGPERFLREIEIAARLQHPMILPVFDSGASPRGSAAGTCLWYTMPFVEGESLRDRLRREAQIAIDEAVQIACEVAEALGHAHAIVADFGIARAVSAAGDQRLTETGLSLGTPAYMVAFQRSH